MNSEKTKVIIITGPTATGKTKIAVTLAKSINGEIISADSRQVFKGMDIGSGKDLEEYKGVNYHLIDIVEAGTEFSVSDFQRLALQAIKEITAKEKQPIICGGTIHYIKALIENYDFDFPASDLEYTNYLENLSRPKLYQLLKNYQLWQEHDWPRDSKRRICRAMEKALIAQGVKSHSSGDNDNLEYRIFYLKQEKEINANKIESRLIARINHGLIDEVNDLLAKGIAHSRLERYGLEYKWVSKYLRALINKEQLIEKLSTEIRRLAKRQRTFLRYLEKSGHPLYPFQNFQELSKQALNWLAEK